jgi:hypothetical protein
MSRSTLRHLLAATILAVLGASGAVRAQQPACATCNTANTANGRTPDGTAQAPLLAKTRLVPSCAEFFTRPCGCWQHHNCDYNCSSLDSELIFIFGGCRQWYGEPCLKGPPYYGNQTAACPTGVGCRK